MSKIKDLCSRKPCHLSKLYYCPLHHRIVAASAALGEHHNPLLLWRPAFELWTQSSLVCSLDAVPAPRRRTTHHRLGAGLRAKTTVLAGATTVVVARAPLPFVVAHLVAPSCYGACRRSGLPPWPSCWHTHTPAHSRAHAHAPTNSHTRCLAYSKPGSLNWDPLK
jgi:hypothetical protein